MSSLTSTPPESAWQLGGTSPRSLPCLPRRAAAVAAVWNDVNRARGAPPRVASCGGGGRARPLWTWRPLAVEACDPVAVIVAQTQRGYLGPPRCGKKHRGAMPEAQPPAVGVALRGEERRARGNTAAQVVPWAGQHQDGRSLAPVRSCPWRWWGGERIGVPPSRLCPHSTPLVSREVGLGLLRGSGVPGPRGQGGGGGNVGLRG